MTNKKSQARHYAVQAIYQWQMTGQDIRDVKEQFLAEQDRNGFDFNYFGTLLQGVSDNLGTLDQQLKPCLDRSIESVDPVERAVLRLGAFELIYRMDLPYRVIINESVELAKVFGAEQGHRYVNGVLDKLAKQSRQAEMKPR
ncbi:MAG: transcription antitermination factor NusB [Gammaproteobacteria bacterium]|nr:transcription antitermination factor NusB [Gammaproteobacteria bacterium]MCP5409185.1 transcription antitermination factor NusB [Chromatiaceae bacterium]MCP5443776.1 transcription antitermination factor NusB [Chromatiaceae bacterium]